MILALKYTLFAVLAMAVNLLTQMGASRLYHGTWELYTSLAAGTFTGLVVKYLLDKRYIFYYQTRSLSHDTSRFLLYSLMGLATTLIFWGLEIVFEFIFATPAMRYTGGALGLMVGYATKYQLDKRFVFTGD